VGFLWLDGPGVRGAGGQALFKGRLKNGFDDQGLASSVFFCRLQAGSFTHVRAAAPVR